MNPAEPNPQVPADLPQNATLSYIGKPPVASGMPQASATLSLTRWSVSVAVTAAPNVEDESSTSSAPPAGSTPNFVLHNMIAKGGMGEVWEAFQPSLERVIAVKRVKNVERVKTEEARARVDAEFRREAIMAGQLEHPNIVPVHDLGADDAGHLLLAMKLVQGKAWDVVIEEDIAALSTADFLAKHIPILIDMAQAVAFAHSRGIVHRDLKPAQVMLGEFGEVQLMDWGLAISILDDEARAKLPSVRTTELPTKSTGSSPSGTPALMAPEQTRMSAADVGPWTDIYLLGGTLYYLLTGSFPHKAESVIATFMKASQGKIESPSKRAVGRDVPEELESLCMECLEFEPKERLASAKMFAEKLQDYLTGAGRRRESIALTTAVAKEIERARNSYSALSDCLTRLSRAAELWSHNGDVRELRQRAHVLYGEAAVAAGDLRLARLEAESLDAGAARDGLLAAVEAGEAAAQAQARTKRIALVACGVLAVVMIIGSFVYAKNVEMARDQERVARTEAEASHDLAKKALAEAQKSRDEATQARLRAEGLLDFMLKDLSTGLEPLGKLDLLSKVSTKATEYFAGMPLDGTPKETSQRAGALLQLARVIIKEGRPQDALTVLDRTDEAIQRLSGDESYKSAVVTLRMTSNLLRATANRNRGAIQDSRSETLAALATWDAAPPDIREIKEVKAMAADAMMSLYETSLMTGDVDAATSATLSGLMLRGEIASEYPEDLVNLATLARFKTGRGDVAAIFRGDIAGAIPHYSAALEDIRAVRGSDPTSYDPILIESQVLGRLSYMHSLLPNEQERALEYGLAGLALDEAQAIRNPTNMEAQRSLAVSHSLLSISLEKMNRCDEAIEQARKAVEVQARVLALDPESVATRSSLASRYEFLGDVLLRSGKSEEAVDAFRALREIVGQLPRTELEGLVSDMGTATIWAGFARSLRSYSSLLYLKNRPAEALEVLQEAEEVSRVAAVDNAQSDKWLLSRATIAIQRALILVEQDRHAEAEELVKSASLELDRLMEKAEAGQPIEGLAPDQILGTDLEIRSLRVTARLLAGKTRAAAGDAEGAREAWETVEQARKDHEATIAASEVEDSAGLCDPVSSFRRMQMVVASKQAEAWLLLGRPEAVRQLEAEGLLHEKFRTFTLLRTAKALGYEFQDEKGNEDAVP